MYLEGIYIRLKLGSSTLFLYPESITSRIAMVLTISLFTTFSNWPGHKDEAYTAHPPSLPHILVSMNIL